MVTPTEEGEFVRLLNEARAGSPEALGRVLKSMECVLRYRLRGRLRPDLAPWARESDFIQDAFIEAQRSLGSFRGESIEAFAAWLWGIQLNTLRGFRRRHIDCQRRYGGVVRSLDDAAAAPVREQLTGPQPSPADATIVSEEQSQAVAALNALPPSYRVVIGLHIWEDCSFAEVGRRLCRSAEAVRKLWGRAVERLRDHYEESA